MTASTEEEKEEEGEGRRRGHDLEKLWKIFRIIPLFSSIFLNHIYIYIFVINYYSVTNQYDVYLAHLYRGAL